MYSKPSDRLKEALWRHRKKFHKEFWALRDINLEIPKGITFGIVGQNGSGKSTLLQIIASILQPTTGRVKVDGRISALLELGSGFNKEFTGRENVFMQGSVMGISQKEMEKRFDQIAEFADIGEFIEQSVKTYSSGMYVRLAFAVAINVDPDILIIDEALAVGDDIYKRRCYKKLEEFQKQGKTIIFVSHALQTVITICSKAVFIDKGNIIQIGEPKEVVQNYNKILREREDEYRKRLMGRIRKNISDSRIQSPSQNRVKHKQVLGSGGAEIKEVQIINPSNGEPTTIVESGKSYIIRVIVTCYKNVNDPLIIIQISTLTGIHIFGLNTYKTNFSIGYNKKGSTVGVDFLLNFCLNAGSYSLGAVLRDHRDGYFIDMDNMADHIIFKVLCDKKFFGLVNMDPRINLVEIADRIRK